MAERNFLKASRSIITVLLCAVMLLGTCEPIIAEAAEKNVLATNLTTFDDVKETDYFHNSVMELIDRGIVTGYGDRTFRPKNNVTWAEALMMIGRDIGADTEPVPGGTWYSGVRAWFVLKGVIEPNQRMSEAITREELVRLLNTVYNIPSYSGARVFSDTNNPVINAFYNAGIINGYKAPSGNELGRFGPNDNITRGDICKIMSTVMRNYRVAIDTTFIERPWDKKPEDKEEDTKKEDTKKEDTKEDRPKPKPDPEPKPDPKPEVPTPTPTPEPKPPVSSQLTTYDIPLFSAAKSALKPGDVYNTLLWMAQNEVGEHKISGSYIADGPRTKEEFVSEIDDIIMTDIYAVEADYYFYFFDKSFSCSRSITTTTLEDRVIVELTLTIKSNKVSLGYAWWQYEDYFETLFEDMVDTMKVTDSMDTKEKAYAAYQYVAWTLKYDNIRYVPMTIEDNTAVCAGYTALYNYMLERMGIEAHAVAGETTEVHAWSVVYDKTFEDWYMVDSTWGDPIPDKGYGYNTSTYFWIDWSTMRTEDTNRVIYSWIMNTRRLDPWKNFTFFSDVISGGFDEEGAN